MMGSQLAPRAQQLLLRLSSPLEEDGEDSGYSHLLCCSGGALAHGLKGEAPTEPQNVVVFPQPTRGKGQRFLQLAMPRVLSAAVCRNGASKEGSPDPQSCSCRGAHEGGREPGPCPTKARCRSATAGECIWQTSLHKQQQLGRQSPGEGDRVSPSSPAATPRARQAPGPSRSPCPAGLISWRRCRRGRSRPGSSPGAPRPAAAAPRCGSACAPRPAPGTRCCPHRP